MGLRVREHEPVSTQVWYQSKTQIRSDERRRMNPIFQRQTFDPAGSGEALLRYVLFFWIMYKIYIFMQCAQILRSKIHILFLRAYA